MHKWTGTAEAAEVGGTSWTETRIVSMVNFDLAMDRNARGMYFSMVSFDHECCVREEIPRRLHSSQETLLRTIPPFPTCPQLFMSPSKHVHDLVLTVSHAMYSFKAYQLHISDDTNEKQDALTGLTVACAARVVAGGVRCQVWSRVPLHFTDARGEVPLVSYQQYGHDEHAAAACCALIAALNAHAQAAEKCEEDVIRRGTLLVEVDHKGLVDAITGMQSVRMPKAMRPCLEAAKDALRRFRQVSGSPFEIRHVVAQEQQQEQQEENDDDDDCTANKQKPAPVRTKTKKCSPRRKCDQNRRATSASSSRR